MDSAIAQVIAAYDISFGVDIFAATRCNILVGNLRKVDELISATIFEPPLNNLRNWDGELPTEKVTDRHVFFDCPETIYEEIISQSKVLLFDVEIQTPRGNMKEYDLYAQIKTHSIIIPWGNVTTNFWMLDLCCGGYGGWQYGFKIMEQHGMPYHYGIGIDHDLPMCTMHAVNHQTALLPDEKIPDDFFLRNKMHSTINASITSNGWKQAVAIVRPDRWCFSFPCQSWTTSAYAKGFGDGNGQVFLHGMMQARIFRPKTIMLENVQGFPNHREYPLAMKIIKHCGYRVVHQGIYDAADRLPTRRCRWLALLERFEEDSHPINWQSWGPMTWNAWFPTTQEDFADFSLSSQLRALYMNPELLPVGAPSYACTNMHRYRVPQICMKTPVFMASYGKHHELPEDFLRSKGLHGFFAAEHMSYRWYHPAEVALLHMQLHDFVMLAPKETSWHALGNSIVIHHAVLMIGNLMNYEFPQSQPLQLDAIFQLIEEQRLKASFVSLVKDGYAWYVGTNEGNKNNQQQLHWLAQTMKWEGNPNPTWQKNVFFHPVHGCQPLQSSCAADVFAEIQISPTIPFDVALEESETNGIDKSDSENVIQWDPYMNMSEDETHEEQEEQKGCNVTVTVDAVPHTYGQLRVHHDISLGPLLQIWGARFIPPFEDQNATKGRYHDYDQKIQDMTLVPYIDANCQLQGLVIDEPYILLVDDVDNRMTQKHSDDNPNTIALELSYGCSWEQMVAKFPFLKEFHYDDIGFVPNNFKPDYHMPVENFLPKIQATTMTEVLFHAMEDVRVETYMLPRADNMVIAFYGTYEHISVIVQPWLAACNEEWQQKHHRKLCVQIIEQQEWRIIFAPTGTGFATPSHLLPRIVALRLFQTACASIQQTDGDIFVRLKIDGRHLTELQITENFSFALIMPCLKHSFSLRSHGLTPSIVAAGKRVADAMMGKDLPFKVKDNQEEVVAHITMPIFGGGGSKQDHKQNVMTSLATMCLNAGLHLQEVPHAVQEITTQIGIPRLTKLIYMEDSETKVEHFLKFCQDCGIETKKNKDQVLKRQHKAQKTQQDKQTKALRNLDLTQYSLQPGFFCDEQGHQLSVNSVFSPCASGVTMLNPLEAEKWLKHDNVLMPEPIAIFVVGDIEIEESKRTSKIVAPAFNQEGIQVLLGGFLVQLGEQFVTTASQDSHIQTRDIQLCAFTMWKEDFTPADWKQIITSPVRFAKHILKPDGQQHCIRTPYGRAFRKGDKPCAPEDATSVQFHSEVWLQDVRKLLRRSGYNNLFVTPKEAGGKPATKWKPIWTDIPKATLEAKFVTHPATAGYIKGRKSTGIRVEATVFAELWAAIKPDVPLPEVIPEGKTWKVQPLPFGVDKEIINEWLAHIKWDAHAIRPLGPKAWIISSLVAPPEGILAFNDHPLLVRMLKPRHNDAPIGLVAGPKSQGNMETSASTGPRTSTVFRSGDPFLDPWTAYQKKDEGKTVGQTVGPTSQYFQHHERRLDELEKHVEQLRETSTQTRTENQQRFTALEDRIHQQHQDTKNAFTSLRADFEHTLTQAMQRQDSQIASSMDEIKNLLLRRDKRKAEHAEESMDD